MTSLEQKAAKSLERLGFHIADSGPLNTCVPQCKFGPYRIDFALASFSRPLAIEVDGAHWHGAGLLTARQAQQREKDRKRDRFLVDNGWGVIRLSERLINSDVLDEKLNAAILSFIEV